MDGKVLGRSRHCGRKIHLHISHGIATPPNIDWEVRECIAANIISETLRGASGRSW